MSIDAGWTHLGSKGSVPMRPASIAARISRSERTTTTEYAGLRRAQREHGVAQFAPRAHAVVGVRQRRTGVAPEHLDGVRPRGLAHREISGAVADHHGFRGGDSETAHRVLRQVRCGLRARDGIATEVDVDVLLDAQPAQDPLAVSRALTRDRRLE